MKVHAFTTSFAVYVDISRVFVDDCNFCSCQVFGHIRVFGLFKQQTLSSLIIVPDADNLTPFLTA
jgi:hypothetical protein